MFKPGIFFDISDKIKIIDFYFNSIFTRFSAEKSACSTPWVRSETSNSWAWTNLPPASFVWQIRERFWQIRQTFARLAQGNSADLPKRNWTRAWDADGFADPTPVRKTPPQEHQGNLELVGLRMLFNATYLKLMSQGIPTRPIPPLRPQINRLPTHIFIMFFIIQSKKK